jgi:V8-like Glu-specific endopeptidase
VHRSSQGRLIPTARVLALSLFAVALLSASSAQAAPQRVGQSPAAVRAYWTAERMRDAIPADRVRDHGPASPAAKPGGGAGGGGSASPLFTTFQAPLAELTTAPVSTNGRVFFSDGAWNYSCSGTAVTSSNQSVVLTAGHCVNQGPGSYFTNWTFAPAYNDGSRPFGTWPAVALDTTAAWRTAGDFGRDVGAAVVAPNSSNTRLTQSVVARSVAFNYTRNQDYLAHGYPAEGKFNGQRLWISDTRWSRDDTSTAPATMGIPTNLNGGSSGGAWVVGNDYKSASAPVASVNSYTYRGLKDVMFGPYLENLPSNADDASDLLARAGAVNPTSP